MWSCGAAVTRSSANDLGLYHGVCSTSANYVTTWPSYCDRTGHQNVKEFMLWLLPHCHLSRLTPLCMEWQPCILADRCQTVPNVCWWPIFIKLGQKFTSPKKLAAQKHQILAQFLTTSQLALECFWNATRYQSEKLRYKLQGYLKWCAFVRSQWKIGPRAILCENFTTVWEWPRLVDAYPVGDRSSPTIICILNFRKMSKHLFILSYITGL